MHLAKVDLGETKRENELFRADSRFTRSVLIQNFKFQRFSYG